MTCPGTVCFGRVCHRRKARVKDVHKRCVHDEQGGGEDNGRVFKRGSITETKQSLGAP